MTIVLRDGSRDVEALLIERARNPADPASGDVALPGGRVDPEDGSLARTALRELQEEVGLGETDLVGPPRFVGATPAPRFGVHVGVFAAELAPASPPPRIAAPTEVAHVFWMPKGELGELRWVTRDGPRGELQMPAALYGGHLVWGFTHRVLREFFGLPKVDPAPARPSSLVAASVVRP